MLMASTLEFWKTESYITLNIILKNTWNGNADKNTWNGNADKDFKKPH